uniref:Uncharacterized protein n=1 Tax=Timspurckia oligopyrenoides TaxID=708627 RepID=A0A7S0ZBA9_9RHOD|mmetsp:Transcript_11032/g.19949  ORF Transcript_11032/g.19949 Transcript_11032/m.19949 type:complete len:211 (+) Transcript_11032:412-1044(+)|eukprot:CAMPEP_0182442054 /NCGR_PEP_ID=MMETSP1172-20130603/1032_1 /TAXON_ID=708627 /ORGANISM="Timspurckia oligopyrenoides, Strain CCMP3278" /LENGTH=210 /DNA_ID=CAMNT_0024636741 /DNA_START=352 /DNA_END=984 /DNA_ORIENTATION=+
MVNLCGCFGGGGGSKAKGSPDESTPGKGTVAATNANAAATGNAVHHSNAAGDNADEGLIPNGDQGRGNGVRVQTTSANVNPDVGGPGRTPPAPKADARSGDEAAAVGLAEGNIAGASGAKGGAAMTDAQKREAEYAALEEEQHRRLVARVSKWVADANAKASEMMDLGWDLDTLKNIEEFSNPEDKPAAIDSVPSSDQPESVNLQSRQKS